MIEAQVELNVVAKAVKEFIPSPQQADFFKWIVDGTGSCVLEAVAGAGKTTTLIQGISLMKGTIFLGAYNKKIAVEMQEKAPKRFGLDVSTMHAAGFAAWRGVARNVKVNSNKMRDIFRKSQAVHNPLYAALESQILELASYAKQAAIGVNSSITDYQFWANLVDHFSIDCLGEDKAVINLAKKVLERSNEQGMLEVDYDDMIYLPLIRNVRMKEYDWVLIDEAQDTNASRRALALLMLKRGGRMVAVGDRKQAIYGFTGADADALDLIATATSAKQLPLTITYRCPKAVVAYAQKFVSHIQAADTAPEGKVTHLPYETRLTEVVAPGDAILCRFSLPLLRACYQFIADGIPAKVEGRDVGNGLKKLAGRWKVSSFSQLSEKLEKYRDEQVAKFRAKEQESKAVQVEDTVECLNVIINRCLKLDPRQDQPVNRVIAQIDQIFSEDVGGEFVVLSTIHKSKGREWKNVLWMTTGPSKWARKDWEHEQENNLCYVATTRAMEHLMLLDAK